MEPITSTYSLENQNNVNALDFQQISLPKSSKYESIIELPQSELETISGGSKWIYKYRRDGSLRKVVYKD